MAYAWERCPDPRWQDLFPRVEDLHAGVALWPVSAVVADGVAALLRLSRELLVDSYFKFEYSLVAGQKALEALEACLRGCVPADDPDHDTRTFVPLVEQAAGKRHGLITAEEATVLRSGTEFRNLLAHGRIICHKDPEKSYKPKDAWEFIQSVHEAVSDLYERAASRLAFEEPWDSE